MKKLISVFVSLCALVTSVSAATASAYDYERYYSEYINENTYYTLAEEKTGVLSAEGSRFNGCDVYNYNSVEAYADYPTLRTNYDYIIVPDDIIDGWFNGAESGNPNLQGDYEIRLPLHTGYFLNMISFELEDSHVYDMYSIRKIVPYIRIVSDTNIAQAFDFNKAEELFPEIQCMDMGEDSDGNYIYYLSTDFNKYMCETDTIITKEDAAELLGLANEHVTSFSYCEEYGEQYMPLDECPRYNSSNIEKVSEYLTENGIAFSVEEIDSEESRIVPENPLPALEYFELISEIQENTGVKPVVPAYEEVLIKTYSVEMLDVVKGDVNSDGKFTIADIVTLKNFLIGNGTVGASADLNNDGVVDVFDMVLMKNLYYDTFLNK